MPAVFHLGNRLIGDNLPENIAAEKETELREVLNAFSLRQHETDYDPIPTMTRICELLEWASEDYYKNNPDPMDQRSPHKILPQCTYGFMLKFMVRQFDFLEKCMVSYVMPHQNNLEMNLLAARILVMTVPVIDFDSVYTVDTTQQFFKYALESDSRELRAYSTLLVTPAITIETAHNYRTEIVNLIKHSLARLNELYPEMADAQTDSNEASNDKVVGPTDFSAMVKEEKAGEHQNGTANANEEQPSTSTSPEEAETPKPVKTGSKRAADGTKSSTEPQLKKMKARKERRKLENPGALTPLADTYNDHSNCSSTVDDIKKVLVGNNKIFPLTVEMEQRMHLYFLTCVFEFTDHVSVLTEHSALDTVLKYLNVTEFDDVRLLTDALNCLANMVIHLRLAWDFINRGGLVKLVRVNRCSIAAAAVCVCLHHLSQFDEIMEHVCQGPGQVLDEVVNYAVWQLGHGYESCYGHICAFFQYSLTFKHVIDRFEQMDGLRVLFNYCKLRLADFIHSDFNNEEVAERLQEKMGEFSNTLRNTNAILVQYVLSHILLKYESVKRSYGSRVPEHLTKAISTTKIPHRDLWKKPLKMDAETEAKAIEVLRFVLPVTNGQLLPITALRNLGFVSLYLRAICMRADFLFLHNLLKSDVLQGCLRFLRFVTITPSGIKDLTEHLTFFHGIRCGIGILLDLIDSESHEPNQIKLALQVLVNCLCGPDGSAKLLPTTGTNTVEASAKKSKQPSYFHEQDVQLDNVLKEAWKSAQENNAIMSLVSFINCSEPVTEADAIRAIACRALNGLVRSERVCQIVSKIPLIAYNELANLTQSPVLEDKIAEHQEFCNEAKKLIKRVHQSQDLEDLTFEKIWKAKVIKKTNVRFDDNELLQLIQQHLQSKGLHHAAKALQKEAKLPPLAVPVAPCSLLAPKSTHEDVGSPKKISFDDTLQSVESINPDVSMEILSKSENKSERRHSLVLSTGRKSTAFQNVKTTPIHEFAVPNSPGRKPDLKRRSLQKSSLLAQSSLPFSSRHLENASSMTEQEIQLKPHKNLDGIISEYFRTQHSHCEKPVVTCPPFSFFYPHHCPKPRALFQAPMNIVDRFINRQTMPYRRTHTMFNRADRNMAFSHYCPINYFDMDGETLTSCSFSYDDSYIHLGMYSGDVNWCNFTTGHSDSTQQCHNSMITNTEHSLDGTLMLTSSIYVKPLSGLWKTGDTQELLYNFTDDMDMSFGYTSNERIIGTQLCAARIYDTSTCELICELNDTENANNYVSQMRNKAYFNYNDTLVLNDGVVWDVRVNPRTEIVHKFDKLSNDYCGKFHPNGNDVIISGYVWDMRSKGLLTHISALHMSDFYFNNTGDIIFATSMKENDDPDEQFFPNYESSFRVLDAMDYHTLTTVESKRDILGFAIDHQDKHLCTIELGKNNADPTMCRIYEIGRLRDDNAIDDDDDDDDDDNLDDEDDDDDAYPLSSSDEDDFLAEDSLDDEDEDGDGNAFEEVMDNLYNDLQAYPEFADYSDYDEDDDLDSDADSDMSEYDPDAAEDDADIDEVDEEEEDDS